MPTDIHVVVEKVVRDPVLTELLAEHLKAWMESRTWYGFSILEVKQLTNHPEFKYKVKVWYDKSRGPEYAHIMKITTTGSIYS